MAWLGAVQAQEFGPAKWALGLRLPEATTEAAIDRAFDAGPDPAHARDASDMALRRAHPTSVGCWSSPRRASIGPSPTTAADSGWTVRCARVPRPIFERALDGQPLTRGELSAHLGRAGIAAKGVPLAFLTISAELEGVICSGPRRGKEFTYAQLAARAPNARRLPRDEALAELTARYFRSHGPATIRDFVWWSGLKTTDAKRGLEINRAKPDIVDGTTYWTIGDAPRRRTDRTGSAPAAYLRRVPRVVPGP